MADLPGTPGFINSLEPNSPIDSNKVFGGDDWFRFIQVTLKTNQFSTSEDGSANGWDIALTVKASEVNSLLGISSSSTIEERLSILENIDSGTKMLFYQDVAPTGWTIDQTVDEHAVRLTKGLAAGGQTGGTQGGTNNFSVQFAVLEEAATPGVWNHTLTTDQLPEHTHGATGNHGHPFNVFPLDGSGSTIDVGFLTNSNETTTSPNDTNDVMVAVAGDHEHAVVGTATSWHAHKIDLDVKWAACIIATKD